MGHWYTCTPIHWYTGILAHRYPGTPIHGYTKTSAQRYTGTQRHCYTNALVHKYTGIPIHWSTGTEAHRYTNIPVHKYIHSLVHDGGQSGSDNVEEKNSGARHLHHSSAIFFSLDWKSKNIYLYIYIYKFPWLSQHFVLLGLSYQKHWSS